MGIRFLPQAGKNGSVKGLPRRRRRMEQPGRAITYTAHIRCRYELQQPFVFRLVSQFSASQPVMNGCQISFSRSAPASVGNSWIMQTLAERQRLRQSGIQGNCAWCGGLAKQTNCLLLSLGGKQIADRVRIRIGGSVPSGSQIKTPSQVAANCQTRRQLPEIYMGRSTWHPLAAPAPSPSWEHICFACLIFRPPPATPPPPAHNVWNCRQFLGLEWVRDLWSSHDKWIAVPKAIWSLPAENMRGTGTGRGLGLKWRSKRCPGIFVWKFGITFEHASTYKRYQYDEVVAVVYGSSATYM